jgi:hypothetical protein
MAEEYIPINAKGQILVSFKNDFNKESFVRDLLAPTGYSVEGYEDCHNMYIIKTPEGKELEACKDLEEKIKDYIEFICLRDLEFERRHKYLEGILEPIQGLIDDVEIPLSDYKETLNKIKDKINEEIK